MKKKKNSIWVFFSSVKLALFVLFLLAAASILGTIIPQNDPPAQFTAFYSKMLAKMMAEPGNLPAALTQITFQLGLDDMYNAFWFEALIGLLAINLIVCSIERLPFVWKMVTMDNLALSSAKISKMGQQQQFPCSPELAADTAKLRGLLKEQGWDAQQGTSSDGKQLLFSQKGAWTRLGVYIVHLSILVIIVGALIGSNFGYSGGVNIPETLSSDKIYQFKTGTPIDLGFTVQCNWFTLTRYPNGAPKEYQSELVIIEQGKEVLTQIIEVNKPLSYKGWTFYQSSFNPHKKIMVTATNMATGNQERFLTVPQEAVRWPEEGLLFGVKDVLPTDIPLTHSYRLLVSMNGQQQTTLQVDDNAKQLYNPNDHGPYQLHVKEFYSTGLQVSKDPGVWTVYLGCALMLAGLAVAFFMSHQRIWLVQEKDSLLLIGSSNKNKVGFDKEFSKLSKTIASHCS